MVHPLATLPIASRHKVSQITFHPSHPFLAIQSHDRSVEIFRIRTEEEVRKKQARRLKRAKEKKGSKKSKADDKNDERADGQSQDLVKGVQLVDLYTPYTIVRAAGKVRSFDFVREDDDANHIQVRLLQVGCRSVGTLRSSTDIHCYVFQFRRSVHYPTAYQEQGCSRARSSLLLGPPWPPNRYSNGLYQCG